MKRALSSVSPAERGERVPPGVLRGARIGRLDGIDETAMQLAPRFPSQRRIGNLFVKRVLEQIGRVLAGNDLVEKLHRLQDRELDMQSIIQQHHDSVQNMNRNGADACSPPASTPSASSAAMAASNLFRSPSAPTPSALGSSSDSWISSSGSILFSANEAAYSSSCSPRSQALMFTVHSGDGKVRVKNQINIHAPVKSHAPRKLF
jgi:hypothetical protein